MLEAPEHFGLAPAPRHEQLGKSVRAGELAERRLQRGGVGHVLVDLHPGRLVVAAPEQAALHAGGPGELALQVLHRSTRALGVGTGHLVIDVIAEHYAAGSGRKRTTGPASERRCTTELSRLAACTTARRSVPPSAEGAALTTSPAAWSPRSSAKTSSPAAA